LSVTGTFGKARKFNGSNGKIEIPNVDLPVNFTLLFNLSDIGTNTIQNIICSFDALTPHGFSLTKYANTLYLYSSAVYNASPPNSIDLCPFSSIPNGSKLALTINNNSAKFYINGVLNKTVASIMPLVDRQKLCIGTGGNGDTTNYGYYFDGAIDELAICDVLTDAQILTISQSTTPLIY